MIDSTPVIHTIFLVLCMLVPAVVVTAIVFLFTGRSGRRVMPVVHAEEGAQGQLVCPPKISLIPIPCARCQRAFRDGEIPIRAQDGALAHLSCPSPKAPGSP